MRAIEENYNYLFEKALLKEMDRVGIHKTVAKGALLIDIGNYVRSMPLLKTGAIKILRQDEDGNDLLLYFLEKGDTCAMTLSCCLGQKKSEIKAVAELDTEILLVPVQKMEEWMSKYKSWRNFVLESYHKRLMELLDAIDSIAFLKLDERLEKYLRDKNDILDRSDLEITHQQIANDLNTSRVVVSRLLKALENKGVIKLERNRIHVFAK